MSVVNPSLVRMTGRGTSTRMEAGTVIDLLDSNFASLFDSDKPLLIDAYAPWCGPCRLLEPIVKNCAEKWSDTLVVSRWNVESLQTNVKIELLLQGANPRKLPTLILVHQGKATMIHSGLIAENALDDLLTNLLPESTAKRNNNKESTQPPSPSEKKSGFISFKREVDDDYMVSFFEQ